MYWQNVKLFCNSGLHGHFVYIQTDDGEFGTWVGENVGTANGGCQYFAAAYEKKTGK